MVSWRRHHGATSCNLLLTALADGVSAHLG